MYVVKRTTSLELGCCLLSANTQDIEKIYALRLTVNLYAVQVVHILDK